MERSRANFLVPTMAFDTPTLLALLPELKRFALHLTRNPEDAKDLVQETYLKLLERGHLCDGEKPAAWAIQTMKNAWVDETRRRSYRQHLPIDDAHDPASWECPADMLVYAKQVIALVERMRPVFRDTLIAHVLCKSFGEAIVKENGRKIRLNHANDDHRLVGEMLGINRTITINQRICRARKALATEIAAA
jgi:RNA polymerase sigma factor (sigma-70 family)